MINKIRVVKQILILVSLSYLFFMLGNGILSLTSPDEVFYVQTAKEMVQHKSWMTPYLFGQPQFEKPILTYWLLRLGFILFGISSFGARFFPAVFAFFGVIAVYFLGILGFKSEKKAFFSSLILMSCGLYVGLARTVFTDMIFSVFILMSLSSFFWGYSQKEAKAVGIFLFFVFSGLAVLTKGPLGLLIPLLVIITFLFIKKDIKFSFCRSFLWGIFIFLLISLPWYIFMIKKYGSGFIHEFFYNDHFRRIIEAEHEGNDKWYFYPFSMAGCMFPWSLYVFVSLIYLLKKFKHNTQSMHIFLICWIVVVFVIFQTAHSKLVSYILPLFPALAMITGDFIYDTVLLKNGTRSLFLVSIGTLFILLLIPIGFSIGLMKNSLYLSTYLSSKIPIYYFITALLAIIILMLFFILRNKLLKSIFVLALVMPVFLSAVPMVGNDIEPYISSKKACEYLLKNYTLNNTILCAKPFVRGVRYYTDKDVAITNIGGKNLFSPHPIPFLNSDQKVKDFLHQRRITYCVLNKSSVQDVERLMGNEFKSTILKIIGNEYLLRIEQL
jgi:4-amino-4-deoxy-L-arabinose transferase-like glycosyltransferase